MKKYLAVACLVFAGFGLRGQKISGKSRINFEIDNFAVNTVEGSFSDIKGTVQFDPSHAGEASFDVSIGIKSIKTGNSTRDADLQEEEYFHSAKFPRASFKSTSIKVEGNKMWVTGDLTIKGITKSVTVPFVASTQPGGYLLSGEITLDRYNFKVGDSGGFTIDRKAQLNIQCYLLE